MPPLPPTHTAALLRPLYDHLAALLRGLAPEAWDAPTVAGAWRVRDVVAHLLDGDLRRLSMQRDGHAVPPPHPVDTYPELVRFLNGLNADWVHAAARLSPRVLVELLASAGPAAADLLAGLDPHGPALFPVAWAGEARSEHWMDAGREYTERWHHQMQLRDAVRAWHPDAPAVLLARRWLEPLLELSLRALPPAYRDVAAAEGDAVVLRLVAGAASPWEAAWSLVRRGGAWRVERGGEAPNVRATVRADADGWWRLLYNAPPPAGRAGHLAVDGDAALAAPLLAARSVMV